MPNGEFRSSDGAATVEAWNQRSPWPLIASLKDAQLYAETTHLSFDWPSVYYLLAGLSTWQDQILSQTHGQTR